MTHRIEVCLGSSCYAKGAERLAKAAAVWAARRGSEVVLAGHRCANRCAHGPRVQIDGVDHQVDDETALAALLAALEERP